MPKRHTLAGQNNVSLEIVCFLSYSKLFLYLASSVHPRHGGGDARKAHVDHSRYSESLEILFLLVDTLHYLSYQLSTSYFHHCYLFHRPSPLQMDMIRSIIPLTSYQPVTFISSLPPVPSTIATVDGYAKKAHVDRSKHCESRNCAYFRLFSTRLTTSSVDPRHGGGDARKAHVDHSRYSESLEILGDTLHYLSYQLSTSYFHHCYLFHPPLPLWTDMIRSIIPLTSYQPVTFITTTCSIRHRYCGWICQKGTRWPVKIM